MCKNQPPPPRPPPLSSLHCTCDFSCSPLFSSALYWSGAEGYFFPGSLVRGLFSRPSMAQWSQRIEQIPALLNLCIMSAEWNTLTDSHSPLSLPPVLRPDRKKEKSKIRKKRKSWKKTSSHTEAQWLPFPPVSFVNHCLLYNVQKRQEKQEWGVTESFGGRGDELGLFSIIISGAA